MMELLPHIDICSAVSSSGTSDCFRIDNVQSRANAGVDWKVVLDMMPDMKMFPNMIPDLVPCMKDVLDMSPHLEPGMKVVADMVSHTMVVNHRTPPHGAPLHCLPPVRDPRESS